MGTTAGSGGTGGGGGTTGGGTSGVGSRAGTTGTGGAGAAGAGAPGSDVGEDRPHRVARRSEDDPDIEYPDGKEIQGKVGSVVPRGGTPHNPDEENDDSEGEEYIRRGRERIAEEGRLEKPQRGGHKGGTKSSGKTESKGKAAAAKKSPTRKK